MTTDDMRRVLEAWGHRDDWNVQAVYVKTAVEMLARLQAGETADALVAEAEGCESDTEGDEE